MASIPKDPLERKVKIMATGMEQIFAKSFLILEEKNDLESEASEAVMVVSPIGLKRDTCSPESVLFLAVY